jgi:hypothetical protein
LPLFGLITGLADDEDAVYHTRDPVIYQQSVPFSTLREGWDEMAATPVWKPKAWKRRHVYAVHSLPAKESQENVDQQMGTHTVFHVDADRWKEEAEHEGHDVDGPIRVVKAHSVVLTMVLAVVVDMTRVRVLDVVLAVILDMTIIGILAVVFAVVLAVLLVVLLAVLPAIGLVVGLVVVQGVGLVLVLALTLGLALAANHLGRRS